MRTHRRGHGLGGLIALSVAGTTLVTIGLPSPKALADTAAYELYCPGTPVGNIVMNGAVTTGTMSPAKPKSGHTFTITDYQTTVRIPAAIAAASAALGNKVLSGTATQTVDASGATPKSIAEAKTRFSVPLEHKNPVSGVTIALPKSPVTVGPFKATAEKITIVEDPHLSIKILVSGSWINLACLTYPNNAEPTGISTKKPKSMPISPAISST